MAAIDQSGLRGKIRNRPISRELEAVLARAAKASDVDRIVVTSGGQPGTDGRRTGSTRHDGGRAADLHLVVADRKLTFTDADADPIVERFVTAAAAFGATGMGAGVGYMGNDTLHVGFGRTVSDTTRIVWGAGGKTRNAPAWLRRAAWAGWRDPPDWVYDKDAEPSEDLPEDVDEILADDQVDGPDHDGLTDIPRRFGRAVILAAQATQRRWGIPASVTLAQWALESGYGAHMPPGSNNPFGIKASGAHPRVDAWTTEVVHGNEERQPAAFRVFGSLDEAFIEHGRLLGTAASYEVARRFKRDPDRFADALTNIYASDPEYGTKLKTIMRSNDLYRFDLDEPLRVGTEGRVAAGGMRRPLRQGEVDAIRVGSLQRRLVSLGYKLGEIDGRFGSLTAAALLAFQNDNGLPTTGICDEACEAALEAAMPRPLDRDRITATEEELAAKGSTIARDAGRSRILSWIAGLLGALGLSNSAVVNAASDGAVGPGGMQDSLLPFLRDVQGLGPTASAADLERLAGTAGTLLRQSRGLSLPPDALELLDALRDAVPPQALIDNPDLAELLGNVGSASSSHAGSLRTIFDVLPTLFADGGVLQSTMEGVATVASSVLPGFGGSLAALGLGLAGRYLANRIGAARVADHRSAGNINPLKG